MREVGVERQARRIALGRGREGRLCFCAPCALGQLEIAAASPQAAHVLGIAYC